MGAYEDLLGRSSNGDDRGASAGGGFRSGLMSQNAYRPSVNIQQQHMDPLVRFFLEAGAMMPDPVFASDGEPLGRVVAVDNFGAGDVVEIERPNGKQFMVPMRPEAVPAWDAERLVVAMGWAE